MTEELKKQVEKLIDSLRGSSQTLHTLAEDYDVDDTDAEVCAMIDEAIFECEGCGWWCERSEESVKAPGSCDECVPDDDD
jgi:hypothetical protein